MDVLLLRKTMVRQEKAFNDKLMTQEQTIKFLTASFRHVQKERKRLRSILNQAANCIQDASHGHTPNWKHLIERIEKYEDSYAPLGDDC